MDVKQDHLLLVLRVVLLERDFTVPSNPTYSNNNTHFNETK